MPDLLSFPDRSSPDHRPSLTLVFPSSAVGHLPACDGAPIRLSGPAGTIVRSYLMSLARLLPSAQPRDLAMIAETTGALLAASLPHATATRARDAQSAASRRRAEIERLIRQNLSSARLDPARISALSGVSRSALYRLFGEEGGIAGYVRALRLRMAYEDLSDPAMATYTITEVAQRRGLHCSSSFSRSFRQVFGRTPSEVRAEALLGARASGPVLPKRIPEPGLLEERQQVSGSP